MPHPPRRQGPSGLAVVCGIIGGIAFLGIAIAVLAALVSGGDGDGQPVAGPSPAGTLAPSPGITGAPSPDSSPGVPQAQDPDTALEQNALYVPTAVPPAGCSLDRPQVTNPAQMEQFLTTMDECLQQLWAGQFQAAGVPWDPANVHIWDSQGRGPCGDFRQARVAAYYCPANSTIYMGASHIVETAGPFAEFPSVYIRLFGHEYGHHVQNASGIVAAEEELYYQDPTPENKREIIRRGELQADCFAGLFVHAISGTFPLSETGRRAMYADVKGRGDDGRPIEQRDHGMGLTRQQWLRAGDQSGVPGQCNTWSASEADTT